MIHRLSKWTLRFLICLDQLAQVWIRGWFYVWFGRGSVPSADETISSFIGKAQVAGKRYGIIIAPVINFIMRNPDHCRLAIANDGRD